MDKNCKTYYANNIFLRHNVTDLWWNIWGLLVVSPAEESIQWVGKQHYSNADTFLSCVSSKVFLEFTKIKRVVNE